MFPTALYLMSFLSEAVIIYTICLPSWVYQKFQIWRIFTGIWVHPQLLMLLFALFSYAQHGVREEKRVGTVAFFFRFNLCVTIILSLFTAISGVVGIDMPASGL